MTDRKPTPPAPAPASEKPAPRPAMPPPSAPPAAKVPEIGGRGGPDPTRYGDWEKDGRCVDF